MSQAAGKVTEEAESGENQAGFGVEARREFRGEAKRAWRGCKTRSREWADPGEARTESGIVFYVSENGQAFIDSATVLGMNLKLLTAMLHTSSGFYHI